MLKYISIAAAAAILAFTVHGKSLAPSGSFRLDTHNSWAQLATDGTTQFGRQKTTFTIGAGRMAGQVTLDAANPALSTFDFVVYPATSMISPIDEEGKFRSEWAANLANQTLVCFHSKGVYPTEDGHLRTTGILRVTRVDRNVDADPSGAYSGPTYGPPIIHRTQQPATFVFAAPTSVGKDQAMVLETSGTTKVFREDFPQLVKTVISTYWPPVIQDEHCEVPDPGEAFSGTRCTGTMIKIPDFPASGANPTEDYPGPPNFNVITGQHVIIAVNLRLVPKSAMQPAGGN